MSKTAGLHAFCVFVTQMGVLPAMAAEPARWQFQTDALDNGLQIITLEDPRTPVVSVQLWYHVGSKDEDPRRQGFAHMFEHMMFRGTDRIGPEDHFKYLQRYGARVNGYTTFDTTVYYETLPASQLDLALWLEAERMARLKINQDYFAAEREVVKEERRMRYLNRPYGKLYETLFDAAFKEHPYRWTPIGNLVHLNAATVDELVAFFRTYYVPNNATLIVVGDVKHDDVLKNARKFFAGVPRGDDPPRVTAREPELTEPRRVEITDRAPSPMIVFAYHAPDARDPDAIPMNVLTRILSAGQSSRLYRSLVLDQELAVNVNASDYTLEQAGVFIVSATLRPGVAVETAEQALLDELHKTIDEGVEPRELDKAKNQALAEYVKSGETVEGRADQLGYAAVVMGDPDRVNTDLDRTRAVTADQVRAIAQRILKDNRRTTVIIRPDENPPPAEQADDKSEDKSETVAKLAPPEDLPTGRSPQPVDLPFPSIRKLANGLQIAVFTDHSLPAVTIAFNMLTGAKNDDPGLAGLASVTASTLRRGTAQHTGDELSDLIDFHAMSLAESVDHDETSVTLWTLSEHLDLAGSILAEILRTPTFPEKEVTNFVARAAAQEAINEQDPSTLAPRELAAALFGDNALARPAGGTSESLTKITPEAVARFHQRFFAPDDATLTFAGDVTLDRAAELAEKWFGDWAAAADKTDSPAPPAPAPRHVVLVHRDAAVQSEIRIGQVVPVSRRDPDYAAVRLLSQLFGESFSGRLNKSLRIEKGLTYGARGYYDVQAHAAAFKIGTFTRTEKTADAVQAALVEVDRLLGDNVTDDELTRARDTLLGQFQMGLQTPAEIAQRWWDLIVWGLPERWYHDYLHDVAAVDQPAALHAAARRTLTPDRLTIVIVGDADAVEQPLTAIAPVTRKSDN